MQRKRQAKLQNISSRSRQLAMTLKGIGSVVMVGFVANVPFGVLPLELLGEGESATIVARTLSTAAVLSLVAAACAGVVIDRFGAANVSRASAGVIALTSVLLAATRSAFDATCVLAAAAAAHTVFRSATMTAAVLDGSPERRTSNATSVGMVANVALALGPLAGALVQARGYGRETLVAGAVICLATLFWDRSKPSTPALRANRPRMPLKASWVPSLLYIFALGLQPGVNMSLAVVAFHAQGLNGSLVVAIVAVVATALRYPAGRIIDKSGLAPWCAATVILNGIGCVALANSHSLFALVGASVLVGLAWSAIPPVSIAALLARSDERNRGSALGSYGFASAFGVAVGSALAVALQSTGSAYANGLYVGALVPAILALPLLKACRRSGADREASRSGDGWSHVRKTASSFEAPAR